jgi:hypothetical protein
MRPTVIHYGPWRKLWNHSFAEYDCCTLENFWRESHIYTNTKLNQKYRTGWCKGNALDLCSGGTLFESRPGDRLIWLMYFFFRFSSIPPCIITRICHDRFLPNSFKFIVHHSCCHPTLYILCSESVVKWPTKEMNYIGHMGRDRNAAVKRKRKESSAVIPFHQWDNFPRSQCST